MIITIAIPGSNATIKLAREDDRVLLQPQDFDAEDPRQVAALATVLGMIKDASIDLPASDDLHEKVAIVSIPRGDEQQQLPTQVPTGQSQPGNIQELMSQVQAMQQRIDQLEQAVGGGLGAAPPPGPPSQPQQFGPGLGG